MTQIKINSFGPLHVAIDGCSVDKFPTERVRAMLLILASAPDLTLARSELATLLWSDVDDSAARRNLRRCLSRLKDVVGAEQVEATRQTIRLISAESTFLTVQSLVASDTPADWQRAIGLLDKQFASGFELKKSTLFEEWLSSQREAQQQQKVSLLNKLLTTLSIPPQQRLRYAQQLAAAEPWDDAAQRRLMTAYAEVGNVAAALTHFDDFSALLRKELSAEPASETQDLHARLLARLSARPATQHNFPASLTSFVGRKTDLENVKTQLLQPACRMLTLLGGGGVGKTRLSVEVGSSFTSADFADGVYFVPLVTANDAFSVFAVLHRTLNLPTQGDDIEAQLFAWLQNKQLLLVLDNLEQLGAELRFLATLLASAPGVKVLATSRDVVGISAEYRYPVTGFSDLHEASALLWSAIQRIDPDFDLNAANLAIGGHICERLHGVPLALELAATWISTLDLGSIRSEIEQAYDFLESPLLDTPDRHRSLSAIFDHSWALLTPQHQAMLASASLFRGGFELKAARAISGAEVRNLRRLVEQSLLIKGEHNRYSLHEMVRQFAAGKLTPQISETVQQAHARYYLELVASLEQQLVSEDALAASTLISADLANITTAWRWAVAHSDLAQLSRSVSAMTHYFRLTGRFSQGNQLYVETIEQLGAETGNRLLARLHIGCAHFRMWQSRHDASANSAELALTAAQAVNDKESIAESLLCHGRALRAKGKFMLAVPVFQQGLITCQAAQADASDPSNIEAIRGEILGHTALISILSASYQAGLDVAIMAHAAAQRSGNKLIEAFTFNVSSIAHDQNDIISESLQLAEAGIALSRKLGNPLYEALSFTTRGQAYASLGFYKEALADRLHASTLYQAIGDELGEILTSMQQARSFYEAGEYAQALTVSNATVRKAVQRDLPFYYVYTTFWKGLAHCALKQFDEAEQAIETVTQAAVASNMPDSYLYLVRSAKAEIALGRGSAAVALSHIDEIVDAILANKPSATNMENVRYIIISDVLIANKDPRAVKLLALRHAHIMRCSEAITNPEHRSAYLEKSRTNRHLLASYASLMG